MINKMNKQGAVGLVSGLVKLFGGIVFIYLLILMFSGGVVIGLAGNEGLLMVAIFIVVLWLVTRKK